MSGSTTARKEVSEWLKVRPNNTSLHYSSNTGITSTSGNIGTACPFMVNEYGYYIYGQNGTRADIRTGMYDNSSTCCQCGIMHMILAYPAAVPAAVYQGTG